MRKTLIATAMLSLALSGVAQADDSSTTTSATQTAQQLCRAERGTTTATRGAFADKYGTNKNKKNAFGKCVAKTTAQQRQQAQTAPSDTTEVSAAKACSTERGTTADTQKAFADKYGTNKNKNNAFGKCVSQQAKTQAQDQSGEDDAGQGEDHGNGHGKAKGHDKS